MAATLHCLPILALVFLQDDPTKWQDYESRAGKFSSRMPGKVKTESRTQTLPSGDTFTLYAHGVDKGDCAFMIAYADLPIKGQGFDYTACVNAMTSTWAGKLLYQKNIKVMGNDGVEFESKISKPGTGWAAGRVFVHDGRVYQLIALGRNIRAQNKDVQLFWNSFKLLAK